LKALQTSQFISLYNENLTAAAIILLSYCFHIPDRKYKRIFSKQDSSLFGFKKDSFQKHSSLMQKNSKEMLKRKKAVL